MLTTQALLLAACFVPVAAQGQLGAGTDGYIIFKDGFSIHGRVIQQKQPEFDPVSGAAFFIPSPNGFTFIDDEVRRNYFPPGQIADTVRLKPGELQKDQIMLTRNQIGLKKPVLLPKWRFETMPPFDKMWEREVKVSTVTGLFPMHQRIVQLSPQRMRIRSKTHEWELNFLTSEIPGDELDKLLIDYGETNGAFAKYTKEDKDYIRANFYQQMGRLDDAERIAKEVLEKAPENKDKIEGFLDLISKERAKKFAAEFEPLAAAKQHRTLIDRLAVYDKDEKLAARMSQKVRLLVQELKNKYESDDEKLVKIREMFKYMMSRKPEPRGFWLNVGDTILKELNYDTLGRLDTFVTFAEQYRRDVDQGRTPTLRAEYVLALAVNGWHLGNIAAEPDVKLAQNLWKGRQLMPEFMKADTVGQRKLLVDNWIKETNLPIDVVARMLQNLPPPNAIEKWTDDVMTFDLDLPDAPAGSYLVQLPPDYNHQRPHPVLMLIHGREEPETLLKRWSALAAQNGFILVAPLWKKTSPTGYQFTDREHAYFMNCLKDIKRRLQVDTDRVFLFGWAQGAEIAWDIGLSHPDQFAGVLPMCGVPQIYAKSYWQNAQNVGFYIVDGDKSGNGPAVTRGIFKEWIRCNYNGYYLEYKGRANELFIGEFEPMMDWMSRKKRQYPNRHLGNYSTSGAIAEEFRSFRQSDNRFYWLSSDEINPNNLQDYANWVKFRPPAMFQGTITVINEADAKGNARIWTQIAIRTQGLKQVTVWLSPQMIDFSRPVQMRVNGALAGPQRVIVPSVSTMLEEYFQNGDRQRLYYAKLEMRP